MSPMRPLTEEEEAKVMKKLRLFIGDAVKELLATRALYYNNQKVLLMPERMLKAVAQIKRQNIASAGTIIGKFTKNENFWITITALHTLHPYALHKVWLRASAEMNFLYGNNVLRSHVHKVSEDIPINAGAFIYNHAGTPLGFGITSLTPASFSRARGGDIVVLHQADNGEYVRSEVAVA